MTFLLDRSPGRRSRAKKENWGPGGWTCSPHPAVHRPWEEAPPPLLCRCRLPRGAQSRLGQHTVRAGKPRLGKADFFPGHGRCGHLSQHMTFLWTHVPALPSHREERLGGSAEFFTSSRPIATKFYKLHAYLSIFGWYGKANWLKKLFYLKLIWCSHPLTGMVRFAWILFYDEMTIKVRRCATTTQVTTSRSWNL